MTQDDGFDGYYERLVNLDAASLCDGAGNARAQVRVPDPDAGIHLVSAGEKMIGRAFPVQCDTDFLEVWMGIENAQPGDVLVIEAADRAVIGELFATEAARKGLAGIIVDGYVRDLAFLRDCELPVYARGTNPHAGTIQVATGGVQEATIAGAWVQAGDVVFGDLDGVVFFDPEALERLVPAAEAVQEREAALLASVNGGRPIFDHTNLHQHYRLRLEGEESSIAVSIEPKHGKRRG